MYFVGVPVPEVEAAGTPVEPAAVLIPKVGIDTMVTTDLLDDPLLSAETVMHYKKMYKELYQYTLVSRLNSACALLPFGSKSYPPSHAGGGQALEGEIREAKRSRVRPPGAPEEGPTRQRRNPQEYWPSKGARQTEAGADVRNVASPK
jgi:hypothetical protein